MNYYRRYSGDYLRKTPTLALEDHGAYCLLLDYYYTGEQPLPLDHDELYTMVRALRPDHRKAVDRVLKKFFERREDGYHNKRADEEIAISKKARENGKRGGRPITGSGTGGITELVTGEVTDTITGAVTGEGGIGVHPLASNLQPLAVNHQPPAVIPQPPKGKAGARKRASHKTPIPEGFQVSQRVRQWAAGKGFTNLEQHCEAFVSKCKAHDYRRADWDEAFMTAIRDDWARLRNGRRGVEQANREAAETWLKGDA